VPRWRRDGKELYYIAADGRLMAAAIEQRGSSVLIGQPRPLFAMPAVQWYEPASDGMRFLLRKTVSPESPLTIELNWKPAR
jgi:hypothetical protein